MEKYILLAIFMLLSVKMDLSAQVFDYVVSKDNAGDFKTIQEAIDASPDNERKTIFIKSGTYQEKIMIGSHSKSSSKLLSIIGEDPQRVIITWDDYNGKSITYDGKQVTSGTPQSATFTVNASDFYAENITIQNTYNNAQAVALYNVADRQTFKNCRIIGYQDTHYLKKARRSYFLNCYIEGAIDYICAGGTSIFDGCTLHSIKNGSYISAPEDITAVSTVGDKKYYYGFIFRKCKLTSESGVNIYLGRPWQGTSSSIFISCNMENIRPEGWSVWSSSSTNHLTSFFAEYNSLDMSDVAVDVSNRVAWSHQLSKEEVDTYYTNEKIYSFLTASYDPFSLVKALDAPSNLTHSASGLQWNPVSQSRGYLVYENDSLVGFTQSPEFLFPIQLDKKSYHVRSVSSNGNLSEKSIGIGNNSATILLAQATQPHIYMEGRTLHLIDNKQCEIFTLSGQKIKTAKNSKKIDLSTLNKGLYIVRAYTVAGVLSDKIVIK
jgi:pectinesterase